MSKTLVQDHDGYRLTTPIQILVGLAVLLGAAGCGGGSPSAEEAALSVVEAAADGECPQGETVPDNEDFCAELQQFGVPDDISAEVFSYENEEGLSVSADEAAIAKVQLVVDGEELGAGYRIYLRREGESWEPNREELEGT